MIESPNPSCNNDCRFVQGQSMTTMAYYHPAFDKYGNDINPNGNTSTCEISCTVCGKVWLSRTQYGETTYTELVANRNAGL